MVAEGIDPVTIERAATQMGFPAPPLAMMDEVTLTLPQKIRDAAEAAGDSARRASTTTRGWRWPTGWSTSSTARARRPAPGFYDYPADGPKPCGRDCGSTSRREDVRRTVRSICRSGCTFAMSLETVKCVDEGVLRSIADANIGSIFGIGFPPLHGGALQYINAYGLPAFVERSRALAAAYGAAVRAAGAAGPQGRGRRDVRLITERYSQANSTHSNK